MFFYVLLTKQGFRKSVPIQNNLGKNFRNLVEISRDLATMASQIEDDFALAKMLESQYAMEDANEEVVSLIPPEFRKGSPQKPVPSTSTAAGKEGLSIIAPEWEDLDPTPDLQAMFLQFNDKFFWGKLAACEVRWSPRMTLCAGLCSYSPRQGYCSIRYNAT